MIITPEQLEKNATLLYERVEEFIKKEYYKLFQGFSVAENFLIIDIGNHQSIHICPNLKLIILVDKRTYHNTNYFSEESVATLNKLVVDAEIAAQAYTYHRPLLMQYIDAARGKKIDNSSKMYLKAETFTYKMYLTFIITQVCPNRKGVYKFKLTDGSFLHLTNISNYLVDDGDYCLEVESVGLKEYFYEPQHATTILNAIKELCKDPKSLKNLAKV